MTDILIRKANISDAEYICNLIKQFALTQGYSPPDDEALFRLIEDIFSESNRLEIWLPVNRDQILGYAATYYTYSTFLGKPTFHIHDLFVRPDHQNKGIGHQLLQHCIEIAWQKNCGRVELNVHNTNEKALRFYQKNGLKEEDGWLLYRMTRE